MSPIDWSNYQFPVPYALRRSRGVYERLDALWKDAKEGNKESEEVVIRIYRRLITNAKQSEKGGNLE